MAMQQQHPPHQQRTKMQATEGKKNKKQNVK